MALMYSRLRREFHNRQAKKSVIKNSFKSLYLFIATFLALSPLSVPLLASQTAHAVGNGCVTDTAGPNDEPGQKDLNKLCVDNAGLPTSLHVTWNWDETGTSGANTLDACSLFDTDGDGFINYSLCVTTTGNPATLQSTTLYSCGDAKIDRCTSPVTPVSITHNTACTVSVKNEDPFNGSGNNKGDSYPKDTVADCTIYLADIGNGNAELVDVCSYPSQQPNSDPSDCVIIADNEGKLEVKKVLDPTTDPGLFDLKIDGTTYADNVGNGGTTGEHVVSAGNHIALEAEGPSTDLANYSTSIVCKNANGTGSVVASNTPSGADTRQITVPVADQSDILCVITNTRQQGTLILQKTVINDNGGTLTQSDFPVAIGGTTAQWGSNTVSPGTYTVSETTQSGYQAGAWGGDCTANGSVTVGSNETKTCTITNNDIPPSLTLNKVVTNDNGGNASESDWTLSASGASQTPTNLSGPGASGSTDVVSGSDFKADTYTLAESGGPSGYAPSDWSCTNNVTVNSNNQITLTNGQSTVCTITNNDIAPSLKVVKNVVNNSGGTLGVGDFTLRVNGSQVTSGTPISSPQSNTSYTVGEDTKAGYAQTSLVCVDDDTQQTVSNPVTLNEGQHVTCTITNDDIAPKLTVVKYVDNGTTGSTLDAGDFPLYVDDLQVVSGDQNTFNAGQYTVSEQNQTGYQAGTWGGDCNTDGIVNLTVGGVYTCTITNTAIPGTVIVDKVVHNNHGGTASASDFTLKVDNTTVVDEVSNTFPMGSHTVSESSNFGGQYTQTSLTCIDTDTKQEVDNPFNLSLAQNIRCTIVNEDVAPTLQINKVVTNDNGGTASASDFTLYANATQFTNGVAQDVNAGTSYAISESGPDTYTQTSIVCRDNDTQQEVAQPVVLALNQHVTCTITNNDKAPKLTLVKKVTNNNGGNAQPSDWTLEADGPTSISGAGGAVSGGTFKTGTYTLSEKDGPSGYTASDWNCVGGQQDDDEITLGLGDDVTCTITNDDQQAFIVVNKTVDNSNGGNAQPNDFNLTVDGQAVLDEVAFPVNPGDHTAGETQLSGYTADDWGTDCAANGSVHVELGQTKTCTITNHDVAPGLTVVKHVVNDNAGDATVDDFDIENNNVNLSFGTGVVNGDTTTYTATPSVHSNTNYTLSEIDFPGYKEGTWSCTDGTNGQGLDVTVNLDEGENVTCTITNDDIAPTLNVEKHVLNDNGGTATAPDFKLRVNGTLLTDARKGGGDVSDSSVTYLYDDAKANTSYDITEDDMQGYKQTDFTCVDDDTQQSVATPVVLNEGQHVTCTFTNNDIAPTLTVTKIVLNPYGTPLAPSAFNLMVDGQSVTSGVSTNDFGAGSHDITETQQTGYTFDSIDGDCTLTQYPTTFNIVLSLDTSSYCTITNKAIQPKLIVTKEVVNDNGGKKEADDFTMTVSGNSQTVPNFPGDENGTEVLLNEGSYSVDELTDNGYAKSFSGDCSGTIAIGEVKYCTIINNDIQPKITLTKAIDGDQYGDDATVNDFGLSIGGAAADSGTTYGKDAGTYALDEAGRDGYTFVEITGDKKCPEVLGGSVELALADDIHCTIHNKAVQPKLIVTKHVINDNSGTSTADDFTMTVSGNSQTVPNFPGDENGTEVLLNEGSYSVDELTNSDYTKSMSGDCSGTLSVGEVKYCTITNNDVPHPSIHVEKSGPTSAPAGSKVTYTFTVTNTGDVALSGVTVDDDIAGVGTYQSGDVNHNNILETTETWIYTADYTIPAGQVKDVVNTVTACGLEYKEQEVILYSLLNNDGDQPLEQAPVCDTDSHTTSIPEVLSEQTEKPELVNTGSALNAWQFALPVLLALITFGVYKFTKKETTV